MVKKYLKSIKFIFVILSLVFFISTISALTCSVSSINKNVNVGIIPTSESISCSNNNSYNVSIFKSGDFFSTTPSSIIISNNSNQTFSISFSAATEGARNGFIYSSDGLIIPINVTGTSQTYSSGIVIFPTSKVVNIQQGQTKSQNIQLIVPSTFSSSITVQSVSFNPDLDVVQFGDLNLGVVTPGQTLNIPLIINAENVQTGTYSTSISILATNTSGQISLPAVNLQVVVSIGVTTTTNETFSVKPSCSLSSLDMGVNGTYNFVCTNVVNNIKIVPSYNEYLEGISAVYTTGQYTYTFRAKKIGTSTFTATYQYEGTPIGESYSKDFKVTPSGNSSVGGVNLAVQFFQNGIERTISSLTSGETTIIALDNSSRNLVSSFKIILNGEELNSSKVNFEVGKNYSLRISSYGYNDLTFSNLSVSESQLPITLSPLKDFYYVGDQVNITSNENASFLLDGTIILSTTPYTFSSAGQFVLKSVKEGYTSSSMNITIKPMVSYNVITPTAFDKWKKGGSVSLKLTEDSSWSVEFIAVNTSSVIILNSGIGKDITFETKEYGSYEVKAGDKRVLYYSMTKSNFNLFDFSANWGYWVSGGVVILFIFIMIIRKKNGDSSEEGFGMGGSPTSDLPEGKINFGD